MAGVSEKSDISNGFQNPAPSLEEDARTALKEMLGGDPMLTAWTAGFLFALALAAAGAFLLRWLVA